MIEEIKEAMERATENLKANRAGGKANAVSLAYDAGIVDGLTRAAEIVLKDSISKIKRNTQVS